MRYITLILYASLILAMLQPEADAACRNPAIKKQFDVLNGYPHGRKGYIVDHVCALACGGIDSVTNMQYQTIPQSKAKDQWETKPYGCRKTCNAQNSTPTRQVFNCK